MELADILSLIKTGKPALVTHALSEWEKTMSHQSEPLISALKLDNAASIEAALKLAEKYHPGVCGPFIANLLKNQDALIRRLSVQSMVPAMGGICADALRQMLIHEQDVFVLASAVTAAARMNIGLEYIKPYLNHEDVRVRANTVRSAGLLGKDNLHELLEPFLEDKALRVQNEAIKGLATLIDEAELEELVIKRLTAPDVATRAATVYITGELPLSRRVVFLIDALADPSMPVASCAARSLCLLRDTLGLRAVIESYLKSSDEKYADSILKLLEPADSAKLLAIAENYAHPSTVAPGIAAKMLMAADFFTDWEPFLPWIVAGVDRKEPEVRHLALKLIASHIDFFRSNIAPLIKKAETGSTVKDKALSALIRWKAGQAEGLNQLQSMLFSLKAEDCAMAAEVLALEKGLIARRLLEEARNKGILSKPENNGQAQPPKLRTIKLPQT